MDLSHLQNQIQKLANQVGKEQQRAPFVAIAYTFENAGQTEEESQAEAERIRLELEEAGRQSIQTIIYLPFVEPEE